MRVHRSFISLLVLSLLVACGGKTPAPMPLPKDLPALPPGSKIGSVEVTLDRASVSANGIDALERYEISDKVRDAVTQRLGPRGAPDGTGDLVLHIEIDSFRLRSGGNAFWLGGMGGADTIKVNVEVQRDGTPIKSFTTDTSTMLGGAIYASPTKRSNRLVKTISERIVSGL